MTWMSATPGCIGTASTLSFTMGSRSKAVGGHISLREVAYDASQSIGFGATDTALSDEESRELVEVVRGFGLDGKRDEIVLVGSLASMFYGTALRTRPVIAIEAEYASGKTTWLDFVSAVLEGCERRDGIPTAAQVVHAMRHQPKALICDEVELSPRRKRDWEAVAEPARCGFSKSAGPRIKRVLGGKRTSFHAPAGVLLAGINLPVFEPATESRCLRVRLQSVPENHAVRCILS